MEQQSLFASQYEEDFLLRTLGPLAYRSDIAMSELVANAWDAGATKVDITVPPERGGVLVVADNGTGMSREQFRARWMTLAYNRLKRQGDRVEFPAGSAGLTRLAYGRNGVGRHGLLCFADEYSVESTRDGERWKFTVSTSTGASPFVLTKEQGGKAKGHRTKLSVKVARHLPDVEEIADVISARFMHDPQFQIAVNGKTIPLENHIGVVERQVLQTPGNLTVEVFLLDATKANRRSRYSGIAFWVGGRLVGVPSWGVGGRIILDGRTRPARQFTVIAKCDGLRGDHIRPDWSGFHETESVAEVYQVVGEYVTDALKRHAKEQVDDTAVDALQGVRPQLEKLSAGARIEVAEFAQAVAQEHPTIQPDVLMTAVRAVIQLESSRSGQSLLEKLSRLPEGDIDALDKLLSEWSVRDALTVLDEIDSRISVIAAIEKLSADPGVDELHTLHPLVVKARWIFGPQFDSPEYVSNMSLRNAVAEVFKTPVQGADFINPRKRPDLVAIENASLYAVGTEQVDGSSPSALMKVGDVLLVELKRGAHTIKRDEVNQASNYVEDLLKCGHLDGVSTIHAFVVGHKVDSKVEAKRTIGEPAKGRIEVVTFGRLVATANQRLFRLREQLPSRYEELSGQVLLNKALSRTGSQNELWTG